MTTQARPARRRADLIALWGGIIFSFIFTGVSRLAGARPADIPHIGFNPGMMRTDFLTDLQAVSGYEGRLKVMPTIIRMWASESERPARRVVWLASNATDGKTGLMLDYMGPAQMLGGVLREGLRRLLRRPVAPVDVKVAMIPAALPLPNRRGPALGEKW